MNCERCGCETNVTTGSYFNTDMICIPCNNIETTHPEYATAKHIEFLEVLKGNMNFKGIGLPNNLKV